MNLFFGLFGWRKASKCKRLIKRVQCRVKLLKNKREAIIRHLQEDVVQLLRNGEEQRAFIRVDQLAKDQNIVAAYDLLDHFCEFILINVPYIRQHKDCPNDINEAASSLLYASARCGDLPELIGLRKLFGERYGKHFEMTAVELLPGNLVNRQVIEKLSVKSISHEVKFRLMKQIAKDNGLEHGTPETESLNKVSDLSIQIYDPEWAKKVTSIVASHSSNQIDITTKVEKPKQLDHLYEPEMILHRFSSQSCPAFSSSSRLSSASLQHKIESITEPASEYSFQLSERNISYLDDVEELKVQPTAQENNKDKDQRLFMFTSTFSPPVEVNRTGLSDLYEDVDHCKPSDRRTSYQRTPKRRKSTRKRSRRRSFYVEKEMCNASTSSSLSVNDVDSGQYYYKDFNRRSHHRRKQQRYMSVEERRLSSYTENGKKHSFTRDLCFEQRKPEELHCEEIRQKCSSHRRIGHGSICNFSCDTKDNGCCLEHPCYFVTSEEKDEGESPALSRWSSQIRKTRIRRLHKTERSRKQAAEVYNHHVESCESSSGSGHYGAKKRTDIAQSQAHPPYLRIMTMPPERPKDKARDRIVKFASCEFPQPDSHSNGSSSLSSYRHIHPKLPDYDELTSRFTALKEEYLRSSRSDLSNG